MSVNKNDPKIAGSSTDERKRRNPSIRVTVNGAKSKRTGHLRRAWSRRRWTRSRRRRPWSARSRRSRPGSGGPCTWRCRRWVPASGTPRPPSANPSRRRARPATALSCHSSDSTWRRRLNTRRPPSPLMFVFFYQSFVSFLAEFDRPIADLIAQPLSFILSSRIFVSSPICDSAIAFSTFRFSGTTLCLAY